MAVSLEHYRAAIGLFNCSLTSIKIFLPSVYIIFTQLVYILIRLILSNDVHPNPGPQSRFRINNFTFGHLNARSLNNEEKLDEISVLLDDNDVDIFAVSETWLNPQIPQSAVAIPGYGFPLRRDRPLNQRGGGVALYCSEAIVVNRRMDLELDNIEILWADFKLKHESFLCAVCYRPPNNRSNEVEQFFRNFQVSLDRIIMLNPYYTIVILGDFNINVGHNVNDDLHAKLYNFMTGNGLVQLINEPTRVTNHSSTTLDLIITNSPEYFVTSGILSPPSNCDHSFIFGKIAVTQPKVKSFPRTIRRFSNVDVYSLNEALKNIQCKDDQLAGSTIDINKIYNKWFDEFNKVLDQYLPQQVVIIRPNDKPWMNSMARLAMRKRDRLLRKHNRTKTIQSWQNYKRQRNRTTTIIRRAKALFYEKSNNLLRDPQAGPKKWWSISRKLCGKMTSNIPALKENGITIENPVHKAQIFNDHFSQTQLYDNNTELPRLDSFPSDKRISLISVSYSEVLSLLQNVNVSKACGHDGIGNKIIKMCAKGLYESLTDFINLTFLSGQFPQSWKLANVIPLFKKGDRQLKVNYRPISLLPSLSKIAERVVFTRLYRFLVDIGFFYSLQSGFRPGHSTINQLVYLVHKIHQALEDGKEVRVVFLDVSKAFDRVWHTGLLFKLEKLGVQDPLLSWIKNYLCERKQRVVIEGQCSEWKLINSGVPQGSVLGPLLFLVYINDITEGLESTPLLFADDTALLEIVDSPEQSALILNNDLEKISNWSKKWLVTMNPSKCETIVFSAKKNKPFHPELLLDDSTISEVSSHTHLGLTLQNNLSWKKHILELHTKASTCLNMLKSVKFRLERQTLDILYKSLLRPLLEYADFIWADCADQLIQLLESIQYEASRVVCGAIKGTSYERLREELGWEKLANRRSFHQMLFFYKIINHQLPSFLIDLLPSYTNQRTQFPLRSSNNLSLYSSRTQRFYNSFLPSSVRLWNSLSNDVRNASFSSYKSALKCLYFDNFVASPLYSFSLTRYASILHTRLRLGFSGLNSYLFRIKCKLSPSCACGYREESVHHYFIVCPRYAAQRTVLFTCAVQLLGSVWSDSNDYGKVQICLYGSGEVRLQINRRFFAAVQKYIIDTNRFSIPNV